MNEAIHGYYIEAGEIAAQVRNEAEKIIKEDGCEVITNEK